MQPRNWPILYICIIAVGCYVVQKDEVQKPLRQFLQTNGGLICGPLLTTLLFLVTWHTYGAIQAYMDTKRDIKQYWWAKYKIHYKDKMTYWDMLPNVLRNQAVFMLPWSLIVYCLGRGYNSSPEIPSTYQIVLQLFAALLGYEVGFYWVHRLLHSSRWLYQFHAMHHKTKGSVGISGMYASVLDGWAMSIGAGSLGLILVDSHVVVVWLWTFIGAINSIHSHGGYKFPLMPSPEDHELHHAAYIVNFGVGLFDYLCSTKGTDIFSEVDKKQNVKVTAKTGTLARPED